MIGEVTLSDGSVLRSTGPTHLYFKHWIYDMKSENVRVKIAIFFAYFNCTLKIVLMCNDVPTTQLLGCPV